MRALKDKSRGLKPSCIVGKKKPCTDNAPKVVCKISSNPGRVTRSVTRLIKSMNDFVIYEIYRCMPLLGDEEQLVPHWDVHIVHYSIVFPQVSRVTYNYD